MEPCRIRLSRAKGFRLQEASQNFNGRDCVRVDRSNQLWGNPFVVGRHGTLENCLKGYREYLLHAEALNPDLFQVEIAKLFGKNLACWCGHNKPCHADILLEFVKQRKEKLESQTTNL